jgi:hypothetical protein
VLSHQIFPATTKACLIGRRLLLAIVFLCMTARLAESAVVTLAWNPNPEGNIAGYTLSYGTTSGQLTTTIDVGNTTTYVFAIPDPTKVYYLALRAYNTSGLFSPFSNEVATTPIVPPLSVTNVVANLPSPQPAGATITFSAIAAGGTAPYQYKWWISNGTTSTLGRDWSTSNTFAWTPSAPSPTYTITVWARNASSTADTFDNPSAKLSLSFAIGSAAAAPSLTSLSPSLAGIGAPVTIKGTNFGATQGTSSVTFNGVKGVPSSWSASSLVVPVPAGATSGPVIVTVGGVASNALAFTVNAAPTLAPIANQTSVRSANVSLQLIATDPNGTPLTYSASGLPPGLSVNGATGLISGKLSKRTRTYTVTARVSDGSLSSSQTFTWTVTR